VYYYYCYYTVCYCVVQLDESCVSQHAGERRVRTVEEEEENGKLVLGDREASSAELDSVSAGNDLEELDLEELASVENLSNHTGDDDDDDDNEHDDNGEYSAGFGIVCVDAGNSTNIDGDGAAGWTEDTSDFGIASTSVGNFDDIDSLTFPDNVHILAPSTSRQTKSTFGSEISSNDIGNFKSVSSSVLPDDSDDVDVKSVPSTDPAHAQSSDEEILSDTADLVDRARDIAIGVDAKTVELKSAASENNNQLFDDVAEFPDTSIDLQHISGNKLVSISFIFFFPVNTCVLCQFC